MHAITQDPFAQRRPLAEVEAELLTLSGHLNAGTYRLLELIDELDRRDDWFGPGLKSLAHWLNWRCGLDLGAAREKVRVARALPELPRIRAAFRCGELSYSKVRAMTRVATEANEELLLHVARHGTASHVERLVRGYRLVQDDPGARPAREQHLARSVSMWFNEAGQLEVRATLPAEEGMRLLQALDLAVDTLQRECEGEPPESEPPESEPAGGSFAPVVDARSDAEPGGAGEGPPEDGARAAPDVSAETSAAHPDRREGASAWSNWMHRYEHCYSPPAAMRADALDLMAASFIAGGGSGTGPPSGHELLLHVELHALRAGQAEHPCRRAQAGSTASALSRLHDGPAIAPQTARRLACDTLVRRLLTDADGRILDLGRRTRSVSPALRRALAVRDQGCRFPGCTQRQRLHAHHIRHWADGGETRLGNLVNLCGWHHHLVHEGGYGVTEDERGEPVFHDRQGDRLEPCCDRLPSTRQGVAGLQAANRHAGLDIDAATAECLWAGERFEVSQAVAGLQMADGVG